MLSLLSTTLKEGLLLSQSTSLQKVLAALQHSAPQQREHNFRLQPLEMEPKSSPAGLPGRGLPSCCDALHFPRAFASSFCCGDPSQAWCDDFPRVLFGVGGYPCLKASSFQIVIAVFTLLFSFFFKVQLIDSVVPISAVQRSDSVIHTYIYTHFYLKYYINI